jgi:hypothetical protein
MMLAMMNVMCEMYDDCIEEGYTASDCEELFDMDNDNEDGGDDGPPDCIMDCEGIGDVDPNENLTAFCEWIIPTLGDTDCAQDCDADVTAEIAEIFDICTDCLSAENCDDVDLNTDENNLLLPEEFTLHPVYPNPFNPTTDIGFSLEYAG